MSLYDRVIDGAVVETYNFTGPPPILPVAKGMGKWLPREIDEPSFDPIRQVRQSVVTIEGERTLHSYAISARPLDERKAEMRRAVDRLTDQHTAAGYAHDFGAAGVHTLQTREADRPNWLAVAQVASTMTANGQGASDLPPGLRTLANDTVPVAAQEALAAMLGMQAYLAGVIAIGWGLKDAITVAADHDALDAIDIEAGWSA